MTLEEQKEALAKRINDRVIRYVEEMGEDAPTEEQLKQFYEIFGNAELDRVKMMGEMRELREKNQAHQIERP